MLQVKIYLPMRAGTLARGKNRVSTIVRPRKNELSPLTNVSAEWDVKRLQDESASSKGVQGMEKGQRIIHKTSLRAEATKFLPSFDLLETFMKLKLHLQPSTISSTKFRRTPEHTTSSHPLNSPPFIDSGPSAEVLAEAHRRLLPKQPSMTASGDPAQGRLALQPGNVGSNDEFPEFCLHADAQAAAATITLTFNRQRSPSAASTTLSSSRASCISTASTGLSSVADFDPAFSFSEARFQAPDVSSPTPRSRRNKEQLHAARLQRAGSSSFSLDLSSREKASKAQRFQRSFSTPTHASAGGESPHDQGLTRMAYAEQQRWITVQQKTFTKWYIICRRSLFRDWVLNYTARLNTKLEARELEVKDLIDDLRDGVSSHQ